jgi:ABC-type glutathione transport system ATPase component
MLIVIRGNSGSGKSTTAKLLRDVAIERGSKRKIALVEQDYLRRIVLKEKETEGTNNIDLIFQTVTFALQHDYDVILEGIFYSERYRPMLQELFDAEPSHYLYYFDVSLEETLKRHTLKPDAHEFGEKQMREWYRDKDLLGFSNEKVLKQSLDQQQIVDKILAETGL